MSRHLPGIKTLGKGAKAGPIANRLSGILAAVEKTSRL